MTTNLTPVRHRRTLSNQAEFAHVLCCRRPDQSICGKVMPNGLESGQSSCPTCVSLCLGGTCPLDHQECES